MTDTCPACRVRPSRDRGVLCLPCLAEQDSRRGTCPCGRVDVLERGRCGWCRAPHYRDGYRREDEEIEAAQYGDAALMGPSRAEWCGPSPVAADDVVRHSEEDEG